MAYGRKDDVGAPYRSDAAAIKSGETAYETLAGLRDLGVGQKRGLADLARSEEERFAQESRKGAALQKYQASRSIVAAAPGARFSGGGAGIMAASQAGIDTSAALLEQKKRDDEVARGLRQKAATLGFEATEYAGAQGTRDTDQAAAFSAGKTEAEDAIRGNSKWYGDNTTKMLSEIATIVEAKRLESPMAAAALEAYYLKPGGEGYTRIRNMEGMDSTRASAEYVA
jgi:hypothetical protein